MDTFALFHGSEQIVEAPDLSLGSPHNDYGRGFYCTSIEEMAKEWACKNGTNGFVNRYTVNGKGLKTLHLSDGSHTVLNWIAILLKNRTFSLGSPIAMDAREYIIEHYAVDTAGYDLITGYRADDSYFRYAEAFVEKAARSPLHVIYYPEINRWQGMEKLQITITNYV